MTTSTHTFYIPVMGLAFTMDAPIKVARFGISSVMSIVEDRLVETMRKHYYEKIHEKYIPIPTSEPDYRAKRITDYLNLVNRIVSDQMINLKASLFTVGSDLDKYFELLPTENRLPPRGGLNAATRSKRWPRNSMRSSSARGPRATPPRT